MSKLAIQSVKPQDAHAALHGAICKGDAMQAKLLARGMDINKLQYRLVLTKWVSFSHLDRANELFSLTGFAAYGEIADFLKENGAKTSVDIKKEIKGRRLVPSQFFRTKIELPELAEY